jgi:hypothetical protein
MSQLPLWIQYCQALAVPVIAIAGVMIALGQLWLAGVRLRHDLYDRRLKVLETAQRLLAVVFTNANIPPDEFYKYVQGISQASFLLNDGVVSYLEELRKRALQMMRVEISLRNLELPQEERARLADTAAEYLDWFTSQPDVLANKFRPFMQLTKPWVFSRKWPFLAFAP